MFPLSGGEKNGRNHSYQGDNPCPVPFVTQGLLNEHYNILWHWFTRPADILTRSWLRLLLPEGGDKTPPLEQGKRRGWKMQGAFQWPPGPPCPQTESTGSQSKDVTNSLVISLSGRQAIRSHEASFSFLFVELTSLIPRGKKKRMETLAPARRCICVFFITIKKILKHGNIYWWQK